MSSSMDGMRSSGDAAAASSAASSAGRSFASSSSFTSGARESSGPARASRTSFSAVWMPSPIFSLDCATRSSAVWSRLATASAFASRAFWRAAAMLLRTSSTDFAAESLAASSRWWPSVRRSPSSRTVRTGEYATCGPPSEAG